MLRSARDMEHYAVYAGDGEVGKIGDLYFDDQRWTVRYLVVDAGGWLTGRSVLISPHAVTGIDDDVLRVNLSLTRDQVRNAPGAGTELPVSLDYEMAYNRYYGWPDYWAGGGLWGIGVYPLGYMAPATQAPAAGGDYPALSVQPTPAPPLSSMASHNHLRSVKDVTGYGIQASDGELGRVEDFLFEDSDWSIQSLVVDTSVWFGGEVLVALKFVENIDWATGLVSVSVGRNYVRNSPPVDMARFRHRT